jgi:adenylate cyclase
MEFRELSQGGRKLVAIMFADLALFTALNVRDEATSASLAAELKTLIAPIIATRGGRLMRLLGNSVLVEFPNALDAVKCSYELQVAAREHHISETDEKKRIKLRIGVHVGDLVESELDSPGGADYMASRVQSFADDGGVCLTHQVYDLVRTRLEVPLESIGARVLKNVIEPVELFKIVMPWDRAEAARGAPISRDSFFPDKTRVAVLPFANLSPDPGDEYFADGITEELISKLAKLSELSVISRTSIMLYKNRHLPISEIAQELKIGTMLEGSVRKAGNRVRVTVQLIDAQSNSQLWTENYDQEMSDLFEIQSSVAEQVASTLKVKLLPKERKDLEKRPASNLEAYQLCLRAHFQLFKETKEGCTKALALLQQAIEADPTCAMAYSGVSDCYHMGSHYGWFTPEETSPIMKQYALKAVGADPRLAEAHGALAAVYNHFEWKWGDGERELRAAIELKPNYEYAYEMLSYLLSILGRDEESREMCNRSLDLGYTTAGMSWGGALRLGADEASIPRLRDLLATGKDLPLVRDALAFAYYRTGRAQEAISEMEAAISLSNSDPLYRADEALLLARMGRKEEARSIANELERISTGTYVSGVQLATVLYALGDQARAFDLFESAFKRKAIDLSDIRIVPGTEELRADPRWISIEKRMGLSKLM